MTDLCELHLDSHSLTVMLRQCLIRNEPLGSLLKDKCVCHIGSHDAIEMGIYQHFGCKGAYYFEANKYVFPNLLKRIGNTPGHKAFFSTLWSEAGHELDFHFYRDKTDGAGGLYTPDKFYNYIHDCPMLEETIKVTTNTFNNFVNDGLLSIQDIVFLNLDVQGAELEVLKGATQLLESPELKFIWCEVSWDSVYKDAPLLPDINDFLKQHRFHHVGTRTDWEIHGDALYVSERI